MGKDVPQQGDAAAEHAEGRDHVGRHEAGSDFAIRINSLRSTLEKRLLWIRSTGPVASRLPDGLPAIAEPLS